MTEQAPDTVDSFGWQWTQQTVRDSLRNFHRRLFLDFCIFSDHHDGKTIAYFGGGNGRHPWALGKIANPKKIISVELAPASIAAQRRILTDERYEIVQGDMAQVSVKADFIYLVGVIQHTASLEATLRNAWDCLNEDGELVVSFYLWTPSTVVLEPIRQVMKRLPRKLAWAMAHLLAPIFMVRKVGREAGYMNAVHTAFDWNGSHSYQHYSTKRSVAALFETVGIDPRCVQRLPNKGNYRLKKYPPATVARLDDEYYYFGAER